MNNSPLICSAQMHSIWNTPERNFEKARILMGEASEKGASLISFPEQFATGWSPVDYPAESGARSILSGYAAEYGIYVLGSEISYNENKRPINNAFVLDDGGSEVASYSKIHLFSPEGEDLYYAPGNNLSVFEINGIKFGIAICYDLRFGDLFARYTDRGVHCMLVPAAWPCERLTHWELLIRSRALDQQIYVSGTNTTGNNPVGHYCGGSMTAGPSGDVLCLAGDDECLLYSSIDIEELERVRLSLPVSSDRREEIYGSSLSYR